MDEHLGYSRSLLGPALGTFNLGLFFVLLVLALHLSGELGEVLGGLDTRLGLAAFGGLWLVFGYTTLRAVGEAEIDPGSPVEPDDVLASGAKWGAIGGMVLFWIIAMIALGAGAVSTAAGEGQTGDTLTALIFAIAAILAGTCFAGAVGVGLGIFFGFLDWLLLLIARGMTART